MKVRVRFPSRVQMKKIGLSIILLLVFSCRSPQDTGRFISETDTTYSADVRSISAKINLHPHDPELFYRRGNTFYFEGKFRDAGFDFDHAIKLNPKQALYHLKIAECFISMDSADSKKTQYHLLQALDIKPDFTEAKSLLAKFYLARQQYKESMILYEELCGILEYQDNAFVMMSLAYKEQKDSIAAEATIDKALAINPENFDAVMQKTLFLIAKNKLPLAMQWAQKAVRMNEYSDEANYTLGLVFQKQNRFADALSYYLRVLKINPNFILAYYNSAVIESSFENFLIGIEWCDKILALDPNYANALAIKGYCYEKLGNKKEALDHYQLALELNPNLILAEEGIKIIKKP